MNKDMMQQPERQVPDDPGESRRIQENLRSALQSLNGENAEAVARKNLEMDEMPVEEMPYYVRK